MRTRDAEPEPKDDTEEDHDQEEAPVSALKRLQRTTTIELERSLLRLEALAGL